MTMYPGITKSQLISANSIVGIKNRRRETPLYGLQFYADLWHPEQRGFCLNFDGNDYAINTATLSFRSPDSLGTYEQTLFRSSSVANNQTLFSASDSDTDTNFIHIYIAATTGRVTISTQIGGGTLNTVSGTANVCDGKNHSICVKSSGAAWSIIVDGVAEDLIVVAGSNTGDWFADVASLNDRICIGAISKTTVGSYAIAVLGQHRIYSRELTTTECQTNYQRGWKAAASDTTGLVFNLPCTEGTGNPVDTVVPTTMTLVGSTWIESLIDRVNAQPLSSYGSPVLSNQGRVLDGVNDTINCGNPATLDITTAITLDAWVYLTALPDGEDAMAIRKHSTYLIRAIRELGQPKYFAFFIVDSDYRSVRNTTAVVFNAWYHVVGVYNKADLRIYVNGVLDCSPTVNTENIAVTTNPLYIGSTSGSSNFWTGTIGESRVYNRALTPSEILQIYNATRWRYV